MATLEMALALPFFLLILALLFNAAWGGRELIRAKGANRVSGAAFLWELNRGEPGRGETAAQAAVGRHYPSASWRFDRRTAEWTGDSRDGFSAALGAITDVVNSVVDAIFSGDAAQELRVEARYPFPVAPAYFGQLELRSRWSVEGNTWTYDENPMSFRGILERSDAGRQIVRGEGVLGWLGGGILRALGFIP